MPGVEFLGPSLRAGGQEKNRCNIYDANEINDGRQRKMGYFSSLSTFFPVFPSCSPRFPQPTIPTWGSPNSCRACKTLTPQEPFATSVSLLNKYINDTGSKVSIFFAWGEEKRCHGGGTPSFFPLFLKKDHVFTYLKLVGYEVISYEARSKTTLIEKIWRQRNSLSSWKRTWILFYRCSIFGVPWLLWLTSRWKTFS